MKSLEEMSFEEALILERKIYERLKEKRERALFEESKRHTTEDERRYQRIVERVNGRPAVEMRVSLDFLKHALRLPYDMEIAGISDIDDDRDIVDFVIIDPQCKVDGCEKQPWPSVRARYKPLYTSDGLQFGGWVLITEANEDG